MTDRAPRTETVAEKLGVEKYTPFVSAAIVSYYANGRKVDPICLLAFNGHHINMLMRINSYGPIEFSYVFKSFWLFLYLSFVIEV